MGWINIALGAILAALLLSEVVRALNPPATSTQAEMTLSAPTVHEPTPARRSRRAEARLRLEEAQRVRRERAQAATSGGAIIRDEDGQPVRD